MPKLIFEFETDDEADNFMAWLSDGGGEDNLYDFCEEHEITINYNILKEDEQ
jgi:hypothetical protein